MRTRLACRVWQVSEMPDKLLVKALQEALGVDDDGLDAFRQAANKINTAMDGLEQVGRRPSAPRAHRAHPARTHPAPSRVRPIYLVVVACLSTGVP